MKYAGMPFAGSFQKQLTAYDFEPCSGCFAKFLFFT